MGANKDVRTVAGQHGALTPEHKALVAELEKAAQWDDSPSQLLHEAIAAIESLSAQGGAEAVGVNETCKCDPAFHEYYEDGVKHCRSCDAEWHPAPAPVPDAVERAIDDLEQAVIDFENTAAVTYERDKQALQLARAKVRALAKPEGYAVVPLDEAAAICARLEYDASWDKCGHGYYRLKQALSAARGKEGV